jgi:hypothetical protein
MFMARRWLVTIVLALGLLALGAAGASATPGWHHSGLSVDGAVAAPASYSRSQLAALPQTTFTVSQRRWRELRTVTDTGVALESLVSASQPTLTSAKNALLQVTITVAGRRRSVTFALGELDSAFGNHFAYVALTQNGRALPAPELVVPGDAVGARTLTGVDHVAVGVQSPPPTVPAAAGDLTIEAGGATRVLSAGQLASLPAQTLQVTFQSETATQAHTETGPTLQAVLRPRTYGPT